MSSLGCVLSVQQNYQLTPNSSPKAESLTVSRSRSLSRRSTPSSLTEGGRSYDGIRAGGSADSGCVTPNEVLSGSDLATRDKSASAKLQANNNNTIEVPEYIIDRNTKITYLKGKFLGKGGFARVHELTDLTTNRVYAGKIIPRSRLQTSDQRKKLYREIEIHEPLAHKQVVRFHHFFKDEHNVYIVLEYCPRKSLVHVLKNRKVLTEPEVRFFLAQLVDGVKYVHSSGVMHRDLKLGNMFLSENMQVKIGDFGLASKALNHSHDGSKKITVCGTPNYIAPEVLNMKGHGFEADIWAIGCIMYAMLVGCPPFETSSLSDTYHRITNNIYTIPEGISEPACKLIEWLLRPRPQDRPTLQQILAHEFFSSGYHPKQLSPTCCYSAPRFYSKSPERETDANKLTAMVANINIDPPPQGAKTPRSPAGSPVHPKLNSPSSCLGKSSFPQAFRQRIHSVLCPDTAGLKKTKTGTTMMLYRTLTKCVEQISDVGSEVNPAPVTGLCVPFVTKWIDYSNKYGFGFQLSDHSVGVLFNDTTRISFSSNRQKIEYHDLSGKMTVFGPSSIPPSLEDRYHVLKYFANYMEENLNEGGDLEQQQEAMRRKQCIPTMKRWVRTNQAIVMQLSCSTLQVNFLSDHTKMVVNCERPSEPLLMYINEERRGVTFSMNDLCKAGCSQAIRTRLQYALNTLQDLIKMQQQQV